DQVAEHQKADELRALGGHGAGDDGHEDGEEDAGGLGDVAGGVLHADQALFLGGDGLDDGGLDDGHQGHVGVGGHQNGALIGALEIVGHVDAGGAVGGGDDGRGGGVLQIKAQDDRHHQGEEDAELGRRAEEEHLRV